MKAIQVVWLFLATALVLVHPAKTCASLPNPPALVVVPGEQQANVGNAATAFPWNVTSGTGATSLRYQQVYGASDFDTNSGSISQIGFRVAPVAGNGIAFNPITLPSVTIVLSTTAVAVDGLSATFADNTGTNAVTVYQGPLTLSSSDTIPPGTNAAAAFDTRVYLQTPFNYNPANGNLLLDITINTGSQGGIATSYFDGQAGGSVSQAYATNADAAVATTTDSKGIITQFMFGNTNPGRKTGINWFMTAHDFDNIQSANSSVAEINFNNSQTYLMNAWYISSNVTTIVPAGWSSVGGEDFRSFSLLQYVITNGLLGFASAASNMEALSYDNEKWAETPANEQTNAAIYESLFANLAHAYGYTFISTPALDIMDVQPGETCGSSDASNWVCYLDLPCPTETFPVFTATAPADIYEIQSQQLTSYINTTNYDVSTNYYNDLLPGASSQALGANPNVAVFAGIGFDNGATTNQVYEAIVDSATNVTGYWLNSGGGSEAVELLQLLDAVPVIVVQPAPSATNLPAGGSVTWTMLATGPPPQTYQWYEGSASNPVPGATNASYTLANAAISGSYFCCAGNSYGSTNSSTVTVNVIFVAPIITNNLPAQVSVESGGAYTYSIGVTGPAPYYYQWYQAGAAVAGQTDSTYTVRAGSPGITSHYVAVTNLYGAVTSSVSIFTSVAQVTDAYFNSITNLNPVGYWPMHETEPAARGDIETNYGTLGLLGTGYYSDWESGTSSRILRGYGGALVGDSDMAVYFASPRQNTTTTTNSLNVPHTSPLSTLSPPFSVECWFYATNTILGTNGQGDIWGESAYEGLNSGKEGNGDGNVCGIRLYWNPDSGTNTMQLQTYANSSANTPLDTVAALSTNQWYYVVVTADANTNLSLYIDGNFEHSSNAVGKYVPDSWMPFEVGNSRGNTHPINGIIDEVAIYTNVLSTNDIATKYSAALDNSPNPTYFQLVTNDNPVIYLRMDSSAYAPPALNTWPVLTNYGTVGVNGVYTPGTMPGIVSGPVNSNGVPFAGLSSAQVAQLSGVSSFADAGYAAAYNPTGAVPFSVTAIFRENPADGRTNTIVGHSANSWSLSLNTTGNLLWQLGANVAGLTSAGAYNDGNWHQAAAVYTPASNPNVTGTNALYVDGVLDTSVSGVSTNGIGPGTNLDVMIGADPQYTNSPLGLGQQFAGQVCEVALFTNALTAAQIQWLYNTAVLSPVNTAPTNLVLSVTNNQLYVSWPADHTGWILQAETNNLSAGIGTNWVNVANSQGANTFIIPINLTNGCVFYRLVYP